jgi:hypothetical protein
MSLLEGYRLFTGYYIYESDMPSEAKLDYVGFLREADADDIIDILSGQYEGVEALTEGEMKALHDFLEEKFGMGRAGAWIAKKREAIKAAGGKKAFAKQKLGYTKVGEKRAALKAAKEKVGKGVKPKTVPAVGKAKKELRRAYAGAVGRTALAASPAVAAGAGGYGVYRAKKKK